MRSSGWFPAVTEDRVTAATDGSGSGGRGPAGWGWVTSQGRCAWGSALKATHQEMEVTAVLELLRRHPPGPLLIQTDSKYVYDVFTKLLRQWEKRNMRTASGRRPVHQELIEEVATLLKSRKVKWERVPAHSGHALNETAHRLAKFGTVKARLELELPGFCRPSSA